MRSNDLERVRRIVQKLELMEAMENRSAVCGSTSRARCPTEDEQHEAAYWRDVAEVRCHAARRDGEDADAELHRKPGGGKK